MKNSKKNYIKNSKKNFRACAKIMMNLYVIYHVSSFFPEKNRHANLSPPFKL